MIAHLEQTQYWKLGKKIMAIEKSISKQMHHPDEAILDDIWRSLWMEETIRSIDIHDISVEVEKWTGMLIRPCIKGS